MKQGEKVKYKPSTRWRKGKVQLSVTGRKMGYVDETRVSEAVIACPSPPHHEAMLHPPQGVFVP